jgi:hypothetical protein
MLSQQESALGTARLAAVATWVVIVVPILIGVGVSVLGYAKPQVRLAKACFGASGLALVVQAGMWISSLQAERGIKFALGVAAFGVIAICVAASWRWVDSNVKAVTATAPNQPTITQSSVGDFSPNIVGSNNRVVNMERPGRRLTESDRNELRSLLRSLPQAKVEVLSSPGGPEVGLLAQDIYTAIKGLGWRCSKAQSLVNPSVAGIGVVVRSQDEHPQAADVIIRFLQSKGFTVHAEAHERKKHDEILIVVATAK